MLVAGQDARVCHLQCRTGYPDQLLLEKLPNAHVYGCDSSVHAIELARAKAKALSGFVADYRVIEANTTPFPQGAFSHGFTLHPLAAPAERRRILEELARIVAPRGQALVAMPLRGSFVEVADLLRECALKHELTDLTNAVEAAVQLRPTDELFARELEAVGFEFVDVDVRTRSMKFGSGRDFFEDPATRLMLLPEFRVNLSLDETERPFNYVREAIDKYWSDDEFELTVVVGVVSGRRKA
ncbi:MAG: class I SAM-dependent methyltransferase [Labilithrix sp.]|nr:class I SAM-dependent methyltransferase [Labilithrix sp.]